MINDLKILQLYFDKIIEYENYMDDIRNSYESQNSSVYNNAVAGSNKIDKMIKELNK